MEKVKGDRYGKIVKALQISSFILMIGMVILCMTFLSKNNISVSNVSALTQYLTGGTITIAMIIVGIGEIILSVVVWNDTDCSVKNLTLLILLAGPVLFILFAIVICLLVFIVMLLGTIIIGLLQVVGYIAIAALVLCCCCGG